MSQGSTPTSPFLVLTYVVGALHHLCSSITMRLNMGRKDPGRIQIRTVWLLLTLICK